MIPTGIGVGLSIPVWLLVLDHALGKTHCCTGVAMGWEGPSCTRMRHGLSVNIGRVRLGAGMGSSLECFIDCDRTNLGRDH